MGWSASIRRAPAQRKTDPRGWEPWVLNRGQNRPVETVVIALAIVVGIAGTLLPILPGIVLVWAATLLWGII